MRTGQHISLEGRTVTIVEVRKLEPRLVPARMVAQFETPEHECIDMREVMVEVRAWHYE